MSATAALIQEFDQECKTTRRVLERVPSDKMAWKPHAKSMSLGQLAMHVASAPGYITGWALQDSTEMSGEGSPEAASTADVLAAHDASVTKTREALTKIGDAGLGDMWAMKMPNGATIMTMPKAALVRSIAFNHVYHHRGQLSVYLRLLDVPVPSIYGPSADERLGM
jgi:uncharacterized damage-inducible protein DinB